jgi:F-type H+-transporting ATPase subunit delta
VSSRLTARRYAKALLQIGDQQGNVPQLQQELESVAEAVAANADLTRLVASPLVLPTKKAEVFETILSAAKVSQTLRHFFRVVAEAGRLNLLPDLRRTFADLVDERAGIVEAKVSSAQPLTEDQAKALIASLAARTGKTIRLTWHQDATLLGGVKAQVGSTVLDASLQGQLRQLKTQLLSA